MSCGQNAAMHELETNRGSDLDIEGTWRDETGAPVNLAGWSIEVYEPHRLAAGAVTAEWVNAALGQYRARLEWADTMPMGRVMHFRLRASQGQNDRSSPQIWVTVK